MDKNLLKRIKNKLAAHDGNYYSMSAVAGEFIRDEIVPLLDRCEPWHTDQLADENAKVGMVHDIIEVAFRCGINKGKQTACDTITELIKKG